MSSVAKKLLQAKTVVAGKTIAVCTGGNYLTVVDITDASNMSILGDVYDATAFGSTGTFSGGDADRNLIFSSGDPTTVCVGDYSDPSNPTVLQVFSNSNFTNSHNSLIPDTTRELLFTDSSYADKAHCIDYSNPSSLSLLDTITSSTQLDNTQGIAVDPTNEVVYYSSYSDDSVTSIDYSTPSSLSILDEHTDGTAFNGGHNIKLDVENDILYGVARQSNSIVRFDVSNPSSISTLNYLIDSTNLD